MAWLALLLAGTLQAQLAPEQRRSDFETLGPDLQAMQRDDARNPAFKLLKLRKIQTNSVHWGYGMDI